MKTNRFYCISMMLIATFGAMLSFSSCGNDDILPGNENNQKEDENETSSIVGTWSSLDYEGDEVILYERYTFNTDKTFIHLTNEEGIGTITSNGTWEYDETTHKLMLTQKGITDTYTIHLESNQLTLFQERVIGIYDKEVPTAIVGRWKYSLKSGYCLLTFYDNGTGVYYEKDEDEEYKEPCYYKYNATEQTLYWIRIDEDDEEADFGVGVSKLTWINENQFLADYLADRNSMWYKQ